MARTSYWEHRTFEPRSTEVFLKCDIEMKSVVVGGQKQVIGIHMCGVSHRKLHWLHSLSVRLKSPKLQQEPQRRQT